MSRHRNRRGNEVIEGVKEHLIVFEETGEPGTNIMEVVRQVQKSRDRAGYQLRKAHERLVALENG